MMGVRRQQSRSRLWRMLHRTFRRNRIGVVAKSSFMTVVAAVLYCMACISSATAAPPASIAQDAAGLLARNCLECHNGSDKKGGLDLTRRERALAGGESGA